MASPGNQHCANCIRRLSFHTVAVGRGMWCQVPLSPWIERRHRHLQSTADKRAFQATASCSLGQRASSNVLTRSQLLRSQKQHGERCMTCFTTTSTRSIQEPSVLFTDAWIQHNPLANWRVSVQWLPPACSNPVGQFTSPAHSQCNAV